MMATWPAGLDRGYVETDTEGEWRMETDKEFM